MNFSLALQYASEGEKIYKEIKMGEGYISVTDLLFDCDKIFAIVQR